MVDLWLRKEDTMKLYVKKNKTITGVNETLWVDFTHNGKRYRKPLKLENTPANRKLAEKKVIPSLHYKVISGEFFKNAMPTVDEYMKKSFELQKSNRKKTTIDDYISKYNKHLRPVFGNKKLDFIKGSHITLWQNKMLEAKYDINTIKGVRGILSTMFEDAMRDEIVEKNPIRLASQLSTRNQLKEKDDIDPFSIDEMKLIINNAKDTQMRNLYMLLFTCGLRGGEALGIKYSSIDFINKTIEIKQQVGRGLISTPKWNSSRTVPIIDSLMPYLKSQFELTGKFDSFVFLNKENTHFWDISKIREKHWKEDLKRAGVKYRKIHSTRHSFCSNLISAGEDVNYVSKLAGHSSTKMTLETYSKYIPNQNKDFGKIFNLITDT